MWAYPSRPTITLSTRRVARGYALTDAIPVSLMCREISHLRIYVFLDVASSTAVIDAARTQRRSFLRAQQPDASGTVTPRVAGIHERTENLPLSAGRLLLLQATFTTPRQALAVDHGVTGALANSLALSAAAGLNLLSRVLPPPQGSYNQVRAHHFSPAVVLPFGRSDASGACGGDASSAPGLHLSSPSCCCSHRHAHSSCVFVYYPAGCSSREAPTLLARCRDKKSPGPGRFFSTFQLTHAPRSK